MDDTNQSRLQKHFSRRQALTAGAGLVTTGLAGCMGSGTADNNESNGSVTGSPSGSDDSESQTLSVASFFSFYDFARKVARDTPVEIENLIPTGLHGHGWEPNASITKKIIEADAFIHVGEDFQPWADRAIKTIKGDNVDTQLINVREGIELVDLAASLDPEEEGIGENRGKDPHFWLDPSRAAQSVDNIADGLAKLAPEHEDAFRKNAETYKTNVLDRIDQDYADIFDRADRDVVQLAAHNAFQYLGVTYGVEMRPLVVNLAASGDVKPTDITEAKRVIQENDINHIGAAVFETRRPAQQLLTETDVESYFPVTPYAGVRKDWVEMGWGYEEIAYNINMPTFEVVLGNKAPKEVGPDGWADQWRNFE
ncbi:zinc ABC transporter solute-binding protein [Halogeometricum borinquense]|uniref:Zinc ABC transporter solute-binding protein n=1 Tax=Halogeometricum borinquense TaxID=60847 RepID=A0A6C0UIZ2_9EURY|nr:metal ABC transporter substrate-binding protein [Halogeometricum borinquense]QIB75486.1 zinc ABC transporter solute-binding protein [Halogeometricum borinquense]